MEYTNRNQIGVSFKGCGSYLPKQILTNNLISNKVDTNDEWIKLRTGISERRISGLGENVSDMGYKAALAALESVSLSPIISDFFISPSNISITDVKCLGSGLQ